MALGERLDMLNFKLFLFSPSHKWFNFNINNILSQWTVKGTWVYFCDVLSSAVLKGKNVNVYRPILLLYNVTSVNLNVICLPLEMQDLIVMYYKIKYGLTPRKTKQTSWNQFESVKGGEKGEKNYDANDYDDEDDVTCH